MQNWMKKGVVGFTSSSDSCNCGGLGNIIVPDDVFMSRNINILIFQITFYTFTQPISGKTNEITSDILAIV